MYFVSGKILQRLRTHQAHVSLEVYSMSIDGESENLGQILLPIPDAKLVLMKNGKREITQIKKYVVDKGEWKPLSKGKPAVRAGLFVVEMPPSENDRNKDVGTPLRRPLRLNDADSEDLGLEIRSAMHVDQCLVANVSPPLTSASSVLSSEQTSTALTAGFSDTDKVLQIGEGQTPYTFIFRVTHLYCFVPNLKPDVKPYIELNSFANHSAEYPVIIDNAVWRLLSNQSYTIAVRGNTADVVSWLRSHGRITIHLRLAYPNGHTRTVGSARVRLGEISEGLIEERICMVYSRSLEISSSPLNEFARATVQTGLLPFTEPDGSWSDG